MRRVALKLGVKFAGGVLETGPKTEQSARPADPPTLVFVAVRNTR